MGQKLLRPVLTSGSPQGLNLEPRSLMGEHDTSTGRSAACCAQLWPRGAPCPPTPVASARPHGDPQRDQKRCPRAKLVVRFPLWTSTSSRIRHLKLKLPGTADRAVSLLHTLLPGALLFEGFAVRPSLEHPRFKRRAPLRCGIQHELLPLRRGDAPHRTGPSPATRAPATLKRTSAAIAKPGVLVVGRLVADDRPGPPWGVDHPIQAERDTFIRRLLVDVDYVDGMHGVLKLEHEGIAREGLRRWLLLIKRNYRALVEGYLQAEVVLLARLEPLFGLEGHQVF